MSLPENTLESIGTMIVNAANECLVPRFSRVSRAYKTDGSIVTEADLRMQERLRSLLQREYPSIGFLGEEMTEEAQVALISSAPDGFWCLDPLDGTSNFAAGLPFFAVSLALITHGEVQAGWVYDPMRQELFCAERGRGAWLNSQRIVIAPRNYSLKQCLGLIDFKRLPPALATRLATSAPYGSQRSLGSVALDWCWLAAERCQVYLHGRQKIWDYAAGWLFFHEAGGHSCSLTGDAVFQAKLEPRSAVAAPQADIFAQWCAWLNVRPQSTP
jgi:myo-inositol-1(or 4)-monophosphatase